MNIKIDMILDLLRRPTSKEKRMDEEVKKLGDYDINVVRERDDLLAQLAPIAAELDDALPPYRRNTKRAGSMSDRLDKKRKVLDSSTLDSVQLDVEVLIEQNRAHFEIKLEAQTQRLQDAINISTKRIITKIGDGPFKRISDPDIRKIWKDMVRMLEITQ